MAKRRPTEPSDNGGDWKYVRLDVEDAACLALGDAGTRLEQHEQGHARMPQAERREPLIELGERARCGALQEIAAKRDQRIFHARAACGCRRRWPGL